MPVQARPFTLFQIKGVETRNRSLKYDMNAMSDFEQLTGMGLAQLMYTRAVFAATRAMLWAGLKHQDRGLTVDRVGILMQEYVHDKGGTLDDLLTECMQAAIAQKAIPDLMAVEGDDENAEAAPKPTLEKDPNATSSTPTTGTTSSPGPATSGGPNE